MPPENDHRDARLLVEYLRRSYHAVDGLWFVMVEEDLGFESALDLDRRVWEVMAKIQARKAQELLGPGDDPLTDLARCFRLKLDADGHEYECHATHDEARFVLPACPWLALLRKSRREHLAPRIAHAVCATEGRVWCREFGEGLEFDIPQMACEGAPVCEMRFRRAEKGRS